MDAGQRRAAYPGNVLFTAREIAEAVNGRCADVGESVVVNGTAFDSRELTAGQLFVPIVGERDGHDFISQAVANGAPAYLTQRELGNAEATAIQVTDTSAAYLALGAAARRRLPDRVIGVTGSVGKTSTKDLCAAAMQAHFRTQANPTSFNNDLGVPFTLTNAADDTEVVVVEMGMRGLGEIARLCRVASPNVGVVTIIGEAHVGRLGGVGGVAQAKGELIEALPSSGTAVLNADQPVCLALAHRTDAAVLSFGRNGGDVRAEDIRLDDMARPSFRLATPWGSIHVVLAVSGTHMAVNAAAAAAAALAVGTPLAAVAAGLGRARLSPWRMEMTRTHAGVIVLNDAYNANPTSMTAALDTLAALPGSGRRVAVLGQMAELDDDGPKRHRDMADYARERGIEVIAVGTNDYGIVATQNPLIMLRELVSGDGVLVKGSRVAGLETLAAALTA